MPRPRKSTLEKKIITEEILDRAIAAAKLGHVNGLTYDQSSWCGTACCVLGFARYLAGLEEVNRGPGDDEFAESPRIRSIRTLMRCGSPAILMIMERVTPDGKIVLTGADLRHADLRGAYFTGVDLTGVDFTGADLRRADLRRADLRRADFTDAVLTGAVLTGANLTGARHWTGSNYTVVTPEWLREKGAIL